MNKAINKKSIKFKNMKTQTIQTMMSKTKFALLAFLVALSFSCSPEDGNDGAPGPAGEDGNANVVSSDWFSIQFDYTNGANDYGYMSINIPNYQEFIDNGGMAMVYLKQVLGNDYIIHPLPYEDVFNFALANVPSEGVENSLIIFANQSNVIDLETEPNLTFRYILVPGNTMNKNATDLTNMSYQEAMNYFKLNQ